MASSAAANFDCCNSRAWVQRLTCFTQGHDVTGLIQAVAILLQQPATLRNGEALLLKKVERLILRARGTTLELYCDENLLIFILSRSITFQRSKSSPMSVLGTMSLEQPLWSSLFFQNIIPQPIGSFVPSTVIIERTGFHPEKILISSRQANRLQRIDQLLHLDPIKIWIGYWCLYLVCF